MRAAAAEYGVAISFGLALRLDDGRVLNSVTHIDAAGELLGDAACSGKVHLCVGPEREMFDEPAAAECWPVVDLGFARVGTAICRDAKFPEATRALALGGADVLFLCFATGRNDSTNRAMASPADWAVEVGRYAPAAAYCNRCFVVSCNQAGDVVDRLGLAAMPHASPPVPPGATHRWPGFCFALGPDGATLSESSRESNAPSICYAELAPPLLARWREGAADLLKFRRPETYTV